MHTSNEVLIWGSNENNMLQSYKGLNPGHVAISLNLEDPTQEVIELTNELKALGLPVARHSRKRKNTVEVYFSYGIDGITTGNKVPISQGFSLNYMTQFLGKFSSRFKKLSTEGMGSAYNLRAEDYLDERPGKAIKLTDVTLPEFAATLDTLERRCIIEDASKRNRIGHCMPLYQSYISLSDVVVLTPTKKQEIIDMLVASGVDEEEKSVQILLEPEKIKIREYIIQYHETARAAEIVTGTLKKLEKQTNPSERTKEQIEEYELLMFDLDLDKTILQTILFKLGYSKESSIGQPPDATISLSSDQLDALSALREMKKIMQDGLNYHSLSKNCSSVALKVLAHSVIDPDLMRRLNKYKSTPYSARVITPRAVLKTIEKRPPTILERLKRLIHSVISKLKELITPKPKVRNEEIPYETSETMKRVEEAEKGLHQLKTPQVMNPNKSRSSSREKH
jgi:hypothetical protein